MQQTSPQQARNCYCYITKCQDRLPFHSPHNHNNKGLETFFLQAPLLFRSWYSIFEATILPGLEVQDQVSPLRLFSAISYVHNPSALFHLNTRPFGWVILNPMLMPPFSPPPCSCHPSPHPSPIPTLNTHHNWNMNVVHSCNRRMHHWIWILIILPGC